MRVFVALVVLSVGLMACGGETKMAPPAEKSEAVNQCSDFKTLMPNFVKAIDTGRTENLKKVVEEQLLKPLREGDAPPINDVLGAVFNTLTRFASQPAETGAKAGELCIIPDAVTGLPQPPPLNQVNTLCEMRRSLKKLVHDGSAIESVSLLEPQLQLILNYLTGRGVDCKGRPRVSHYELATVVNGLCAQDANCQITTGLDLVTGLSAYIVTPEGQKLVTDLTDLVNKPSFKGLYNTSGLTESDSVAIVRALIPALQSANAADLDNAFNSLPLGADLKNDLKPIVADLKVLLANTAIITPTRQALNCFTLKDKNLDTIRMFYRLAIEEACPDFALAKLTSAADRLNKVDERGSLTFLASTLAKAVRADEQAIDSAAVVCRTLTSTTPAPNNGKSNAELTLPVAAELVQDGVVNEAICAADTLLFGCAPGPTGDQPACR